MHAHARLLVLRLEHVPFVDATGMQALWDLRDTCNKHDTRLVLCGMRTNVRYKLQRAGLLGQLGAANVIDDLTQLT
ncbi:sodium-independent anion transporter [Methylovorus glucosotrophus]|uniref:sodium-independent anion transporter n=1 Tax=Methylovorus glucosotrophus TaxID=266009 RepID=UPI001FD446C8|nr:sodium-independent anion transporter [Methylovorus glucosotrophus]